jgi:hypothetical protein
MILKTSILDKFTEIITTMVDLDATAQMKNLKHYCMEQIGRCGTTLECPMSRGLSKLGTDFISIGLAFILWMII